MIEILPNTPINVVAVTATGKVSGSDYDKILIPAIEAALAASDKIRILYHFGPEYTGFLPAAAWDDARVGMKHFTHYERIAIVSDDETISRSIKAFGFLIPGDVKCFAEADLGEALAWISA